MTANAPTPPFDNGTIVDAGTDYVRASIVGGVGIIELNQPERRNALHAEMYDAVPDLIGRYESDPAVGSILLSGAGEGFCAGGDVQAGVSRSRSQNPPPPSDLAHDARLVLRLRSSPLISIAALPGAAVGAGLSIALAADLRIAARSARLIGGWGRLGFSGDFGGAWFLTRLVGPAKALELLVDNTALSAEQAFGLGLVNKVVEDHELRVRALDWALALAAGSRPANMLMKRNIQDSLKMTLADYLPIESGRQREAGQTEEHRDAVRLWLSQAKAKRAGAARPTPTELR